MWYSVNQELALKILKEIHEGRNSFADLEKNFGKEKDFVATLTTMFQNRNNAAGLLRYDQDATARTFSIVNSSSDVWKDPIQKFLKENGYAAS